VCGGKACIAGTRIRVMDVVFLHDHAGTRPEEIIHVWDGGVTLADVHAALAYALDHPDEIAHDFEVHRQAAEYGKTQPSLLRDALAKDPTLRDRFRV
jgi:uncharacterized protein (DUF433 family)